MENKMKAGGTFVIMLLVLWETYAQKFDPDLQQLKFYKESHPMDNGSLTTSNGAPVDYLNADNSFDYKSLIDDEYFMDIITHLSRERIPERFVHAKGAGAHGYFIVTHDVTDICQADFLSEIGKKTKVFVRFSTLAGERGSSDTIRDVHGFAVKFYTKDGNFDFVGINLPVFVIKDPLKFPSFVHARKKNPVTNLYDDNTIWDFITLNPEAAFQFLYIFTDFGIPLGYRFMPGHSVHTYQFINSLGNPHFARLIFLPDQGIKNLTADQATKIGGVDSDYLTRDLYKAIGRNEFPSWILYFQDLTLEQIKKIPFDPFDVSRILPFDSYPLKPVGRLVLNRNPKNYFAEVEQVAFCPGNLVPGIIGAPDQMFQARRFSYRDTQLYRLGVNFRKIPVNCPYKTHVKTYLRDGLRPSGYSVGSSPNYYPNSFHGPTPRRMKSNVKLIEIQQTKPYNLDQASDFIYSLTEKEFSTVIENILYSLSNAYTFLQDRAVNLLSFINFRLGDRVKKGLSNNKTSVNQN